MSGMAISDLIQWVLIIALLLAVWALARQVGVLYERVAPIGALVTDAGPGLGQPSPVLDVPTLAGETLHIGASEPRSTLLFFLSPTCPVCKKLLPALRSAAQAESNWLRVLLASDGDMPEHLSFYRQAGLAPMPYLLSTELGMAFRVNRLPYAVLIDETGTIRAKGLINSREHLDSLFNAKELGAGTVQEFLRDRTA
ncbi:MAG: thiol-disulfide isomerase [Burkholderiaceae bacterium]